MRVLLLAPGAGPADAPEHRAAAGWLAGAGFDTTVALRPTAATLASCDVAWCHAVTVPAVDADWGATLAAWAADGGGVLLTLAATALVPSLGIHDRAPVMGPDRPWTDEDDPLWPAGFRDWPDFPHVRGFQGWGDHPLFAGLRRGAFTWRATAGAAPVRASHREPDWPAARVVAVERAYVQLDAREAVAWEYEVGAGRVLCLGANVELAGADPSLGAARDRLLVNAIRHLAGRQATTAAMYWPSGRRHATVGPVPLPDERRAPHPACRLEPGLALTAPDESPFALGGERALLLGTERGGVREVWIHPLCLTDDLDAPDFASVEAVRVTPGDVVRALTDREGNRWEEHVVVSPEGAAAHLALRLVHAASRRPTAGYVMSLPLRLQWPMPPDALVPLRQEVRQERDRASILVTARDGRHVALVRVQGAAGLEWRDHAERPALRLTAGPDAPLVVSFTAATDGAEALVRRGTSQPDHDLQRQRDRLEAVTRHAPTLSSPVGVLDEGVAWATHRLATFAARDSGGLRGLLAGFAPTRPGWAISRPGYAWFFGRDACWCIDALLASGQFGLARDAIDLLVSASAPDGKVVHELTTSGVAHYDAADSTPLLLRAVARYAEWTGDVESVRHWWPWVGRGLDFVASTDRDGGGLPWNRGVGHGWVESGPLGGGVVTSYVAAIWIDALHRLGPLATHLGHAAAADRVGRLLGAARAGLERLRSTRTGRLALHRDANGRLPDELTALAAVPIALGVDSGTSAAEVVEALGDARFSAPWGLRMLPTDDPRYAPRGYHAGAVWPLFTGWASLAAFNVGQADRGVAWLLANARRWQHGSKGAFEEVLDGDTGAPAGVCADQAWSAAMVVSPAVLGLFGLAPVAYAGRVGVRASLPAGWAHAGLTGLRVGSSTLAIAVRRGETSAPHVHAHCVDGPPLRLSVAGVPCHSPAPHGRR